MENTMKTYYVYWYKLKEFNNPHCQGYIGITNNIVRRNLEHLRCIAKPTHFSNALTKYGEAVTYEILHTVNVKQEALDYEFYYRPENNIGWNMATGGKDTLGSIQRRKVTLYHKSDHTKLYTFDSIANASEELGVTRARIAQALYRKSPHYGFDGWAVLLNDTHDRSTTTTIQEIISLRITGIKRTKPSHFKGVTDRWSEEDKKRIGNQHRGKKLSKEHVEKLKECNRYSPTCKKVTLVHKSNPGTEITYHSISEAARQLDIPLSRLKAKAIRKLNVYGNDGWKIIKLGSA